MKKRLLLLAGILVLGATTFAATGDQTVDGVTSSSSDTIDSLLVGRQTGYGAFGGTYTGEVKTRHYQGPGRSNKSGDVYINETDIVEFTLAKGKLNFGDFGFIYDVDRDVRMNKKWEQTRQGWDTTFGVDYQGGTFDMLGKEWKFNPSLVFDYDEAEGYTDEHPKGKLSDHETKRLWKLNPKISTTYYGFATDISPIFAYDDVSGNLSFQLDVSLFRKISDSWSYYGDFYMDVAGTKDDDSYANSLYSGNISKDEKVAFSMEQYLNYSRQISDTNLYFSTEFGLEAYSLLQSDASKVGVYAAPKLQYKAKIGSWNVAPYVMYTAYAKTDNYKAAASDGVYSNQLSLGVTFGTSF